MIKIFALMQFENEYKCLTDFNSFDFKLKIKGLIIIKKLAIIGHLDSLITFLF